MKTRTDDVDGIVDSMMRRPLEKSLLRYAVQRAMFCGNCKGILDFYTNAVLVEPDDMPMFVYCVKCFDDFKQRIVKRCETSGIEVARIMCHVKATDCREFTDVPCLD